MIQRATHLDAAAQARFDALQHEIIEAVERHRHAIVALVDDEDERRRLAAVLWKDDDSLPRGHTAGGHVAALLIRMVWVGVGGPASSTRMDLERYAVAFQRYADLFDDLIDHDVSPGREGHVLLRTQTLLAVSMELLARCGAESVAYWARRLQSLVSAVSVETTANPSLASYMEAIDRQSWFYGHLAGLAALCAGQSDQLEVAEELGRAIYRYDQFTRDESQRGRESDSASGWSATRWLDSAAIEDQLRQWQAKVWSLAARLPNQEAGSALQALVSVDHGSSPVRPARTGGARSLPTSVSGPGPGPHQISDADG